MSLFFPEWSDLGDMKPGKEITDNWDAMLMQLNEYERYFSGEIFEETVPGTYEPGEEPPLLYPVGMNIVKSMVLTHTDAAFGEYQDMPVLFAAQNDDEISTSDEAAIKLMQTIFEENDMGSVLWEAELDRNKFGAGVYRVGPKLPGDGHISINRILRDSFFPIFDPEDPNELLQATVLTRLSKTQAALKYNYRGDKEEVIRAEVWTKNRYRNYLDGMEMPTASNVNPWGIVPFIFEPRYRSNNPMGESLTADLVPVQNDFNARMADISENVNYNSHPIIWGKNMPRAFNSDNYPVGPGVFWDMGRNVAGVEPEIGMLEAKNTVQPGVMDFMKFVYSWAETAAEAPPIAFGKDDGGGQRSGVTLEIRMWPLIKAVRRSRLYKRAALRRMMKIIAAILRQKNFSNISNHAITAIEKGRISPIFYPVMPRDQAALVDEVQKLLATDPPSISIETAQKILGRGHGEVIRILNMVADEKLWKKTNATTQPQEKENERPDLKEKND